MAIFNRNFFKARTKNDFSYVNYDDYESIEKSFHQSKAAARSAVDSLDVGAPSGRGQNDFITKEDILRKKKTLRFYSQNIIVQSIIRVRTNQVNKYATPASWSPDGIGYIVYPKYKRGKHLTKEEKERSKELEEIIYYTGKDFKAWRDTLPKFLTKFISDHYVYDQVNIERVFEQQRGTQLNHFNIADAGTILINKYPKSIDKPREFVQWIDGRPGAKFTEKEMTFLTAWAQSDIHRKGYGYSPTESSLEHLGFHSNTEQFNSRFFSQGGMVRGLLVINADGTQQDSAAALESIRRSWMPLQGVNGAWKIPMVTAQDAKFVNMTQNSKDMEFSEWLNYTIKVICADFNIQTEEINIMNKGGATGRNVGSTLNEGNSVKSKMQQSKDTGLEPLLKFIEQAINDQILRYLDSDYRFEFTTGDTQDEKSRVDIIKGKEDAGLTINEGRKAMNVAPLSGIFAKLGDMPGSPATVVQFLNVLAKADPQYQSLIQHTNDYKDPNNKAPDINPNANKDQQPAVPQDNQENNNSDNNTE